MMDRSNRDRDNNPGGRPLHTYTPRSHEDLLRSHLQLDANRNAKLQNELQRLADENKKLRENLDDAEKEIKDKENEIEDLKKKLREQPRSPPPPERSSVPDDRQRVFEIDGKPVTLDQILNHFAGVIQKHHDLLNKKNQQIDDLEDALRNRPTQQPKDMRHTGTHMAPKDDTRQEDFAKELALIRKEYEQVEHILTDRNNKLENLIEDLRRKLDQYADEIGHLRKELASRGTDPNDNTMVLLKEKEKENDYLKDLINSLKNQPQNVMLPDTTNEDLENEIKKIIEDKKNAVKKLSNMIIELKKTPSGQVADAPDMSDVEKECKEMMGDLNNMNDKLNNVLQKLRQTPQTAQGEPVNKDDLLRNLNHLKRQCEDEIEALKNQVKDPSDSPVVLTGIGRVRIDDPELLKRKYPDGQLPDEPVNVPSNVQFYLYPSQGAPVQQQPSRRRRSSEPYEPDRYGEPTRYSDPVRPRIPDPTPESSLKSFRPVDYRPVSPEASYRHLPIKPKPKDRLYPEIPSETRSISSKPRPHVSCEACQDDYIPFDHGTPTHPPDKEQPTREKPKKKGCCGGKGSKTSNVPYEKSTEKEEIVTIHQPESSHHKQPKQKKSDHSHPPKTKKSDHSPPPKPTKSDHSPQSTSRTPEDSPKPKRKLVSKLKVDRHH